jgi:hypothetical protein
MTAKREWMEAELALEHAHARLAERDLAAAVAAFYRAENAGAGADPCSGGRWFAHMLAGDFAAAWAESDAIRRRGAPDPNRFWGGEDLRGKRVMLRCLHGFGDAVQFLRYAPQVQALAEQLIVEVPPPMVETAACLDGVDHVITWGSGSPETAYDWEVQGEVMELPYLFRTERKHLPLATGYLRLPARAASQAAQAMALSSAPRVGIVWAAGKWNPERSLPLQLLRPLLESADCEFWCLQGGDARAEWMTLPAPLRGRDAACCGEGILPLAAAIAQLDLVITVDTLAAHLAGALGKEAWVLLQYAADWRWMTARSDSPWYPSLRLFRQASPGDWKSLTEHVKGTFADWLAERAPSAAA